MFTFNSNFHIFYLIKTKIWGWLWKQVFFMKIWIGSVLDFMIIDRSVFVYTVTDDLANHISVYDGWDQKLSPQAFPRSHDPPLTETSELCGQCYF